jgi:hypothetical protein
MAKPKRKPRTKSVSTEEKREPLEIVVNFSLPDPPPLAFPGAKPTDTTAKKADGPDLPPVIFRF